MLGPKALLKQRDRECVDLTNTTLAISRSPSSPVDEALTNLDKRYLSLLESRLIPITGWHRILRTSTGQSVAVPSYPLASKAFRFAYLAFAARQFGSPTLDSSLYLQKFYQYTNAAIVSTSHLEVCVASCMAFLHELVEFRRHHCFRYDLLVHLKGMWTALARLKPDSDNKLLVQAYQVCFVSIKLTRITCKSSRLLMENQGLLVTICETLELMWDSIAAYMPLLHMSTDQTDFLHAIEILSDCFDLSLDCYFLSRTRLSSIPEILTSVSRSLQRGSRQIIHLASQIPVIVSLLSKAGIDQLITHSSSLPNLWNRGQYGICNVPSLTMGNIVSSVVMAHIILEIFSSRPIKENRLISNAIRLRNLHFMSAKGITILFMGGARSLFWAGMILTRVLNPEGLFLAV